jgi:hypothetical protein
LHGFFTCHAEFAQDFDGAPSAKEQWMPRINISHGHHFLLNRYSGLKSNSTAGTNISPTKSVDQKLKPARVLPHVDVVEHDISRFAGLNQSGNHSQFLVGKDMFEILAAMQS